MTDNREREAQARAIRSKARTAARRAYDAAKQEGEGGQDVLTAALDAYHATLLEPAPLSPEAVELLNTAWGIIANVGGGNWYLETEQWRGAAERWRDSYHAWLKQDMTEPVSLMGAMEYIMRQLGLAHQRDAGT
jgi:hypothetical protein